MSRVEETQESKPKKVLRTMIKKKDKKYVFTTNATYAMLANEKQI